ncbi:hypothetical protein [Fibrella aquatilis]|uniref:DUF393 domain-containing protein n=1 Tax=Fibrella aquatilis TaxID=2817059 RepID=A0A939G5Z4_9BACT|nr:hypothetical protein [Fibrella aquatilis]MBO0930408.1 hypothetical protein [Fibrella aquatilis]
MNKVLIYDADCPLCRAYTKGLVMTGALPAAMRVSSSAVTDQRVIDQLDPVRRRHEIPLLDLETGETHYGVDAVLTVLGTAWPRFVCFVRDTALFEIGRQFYAFISYNRRVMFPVAPERWHVMDLDPDLHVGYRMVFLVLLYAALAMGHLGAVGHMAPLAVAALAGQLGLALVYIRRHSGNRLTANVLDYVGHLGVSILAGGVFKAAGVLLDLPMLLLLGNAVMIWQLAVRQRVMQLPDYVLIPFIIFTCLNH